MRVTRIRIGLLFILSTMLPLPAHPQTRGRAASGGHWVATRATAPDVMAAPLRADFDRGDHIHPNDARKQAITDAFDLNDFEK
jgi:hypothetical protein